MVGIENKRDLVIYIIIFILGIFFLIFLKTIPVREAKKVIKENNYNCKMVINSEKNNKYPYLYYIKDTNCKDNVSEKEPFKLVKFKVSKTSLTIKNEQDKNEMWYNELNKQIRKYKSNEKCNQCISIKENKNTYYINIKDLKKIEETLDK